MREFRKGGGICDMSHDISYSAASLLKPCMATLKFESWGEWML